ncbi:MAG: hypothetical protein EPN41_07755 [Candidimonas sp.]|nr:MAG: hypothetical protein EPN41_07755 [Candidimonas sp.]
MARATDKPGSGADPARRLRDSTRAVALRYEPQWHAPRVVAKGYGHIGQSIIDTAREHGVAVTESPQLVELLMGLDLDREIPQCLYRAVAEVLAWVLKLDSAGPRGES